MGMNISNICYLKKDNIQGDYIVYVRQKLKNQTTRHIKIKKTQTICNLTDKWSRDDSDYIFHIIQKNAYKDYMNFKRYANNRLKEIGEMVDCPVNLTTNVARHTWASRAADIGISLGVIRDSLNHQNTKTTEDYLDSIDSKRINDANDQVTDF
jgi:integrase